MVDRRGGVQVPRLGLLLPVATPESPGPDPFERLVGLAVAAESAGFDAVWVHDGPGPRAASLFEPYSLLGALAARTGRVALAVLPDGPPVRHPSLMAKTVASLDVISHGRAVLSLGVGPPSDPEAGERLAEELEICLALLTRETATVTGRHYRITGAANRPGPVRPGGVPLVVATDRGDVVVASGRSMDAVVVSGGPDRVGNMMVALRERSPDADVAAASPPVVLWRGSVGGTGPDGVASTVDRLGRLAGSGAGGFVVDLGAEAGPEEVARFGQALEPVAARARAATAG